MAFPAFLDTCVLYPAYLCDALLRLAEAATYRPLYRHVLAATVRANAEVLVTFNMSDFPGPALKPYDVEAIHPDEFLLDQLDLYPGATVDVLRQQAAAYRRVPNTVPDILVLLERTGVPRFAAEARRHL